MEDAKTFSWLTETNRVWNEKKRSRFTELRLRVNDNLSAQEIAELAALMQELEAAEAAYLQPAIQKLRLERETMELQNRRLETLASRKELLARRLRAFLEEAECERRAIDSELAAVLPTTPTEP